MNCYIHDSPVEYHGGAAIIAGYVSHMNISHNEIGNIPYSAISMGWGWGKNSYAHNNVASYNNLYNWTSTLKDGAAIYCLSSQPGSELHHNYGHDASGTGWYPDEGSAYINIYNNVLARIQRGSWLNIWEKTINHIVVSDNYADTPKLRNDGSDITFTNNTVLTGSNWPQGAIDIMSGAGIEKEYLDIKYATCGCSSMKTNQFLLLRNKEK
jgi:hypothetical protein